MIHFQWFCTHCVWWSGQCVLQFDDLIFSSRRTTTVSDCICSTMSAIRPVQFCLLEESRERRRERNVFLCFTQKLSKVHTIVLLFRSVFLEQLLILLLATAYALVKWGQARKTIDHKKCIKSTTCLLDELSSLKTHQQILISQEITSGNITMHCGQKLNPESSWLEKKS